MVIQFIRCGMSDPRLAQQQVSNADSEVYAQWTAYWAQQQAAFWNSPWANGQQAWPPSSNEGTTASSTTTSHTATASAEETDKGEQGDLSTDPMRAQPSMSPSPAASSGGRGQSPTPSEVGWTILDTEKNWTTG